MLQKLRFWLIKQIVSSSSVVMNVNITKDGIFLKPKSLITGCSISLGYCGLLFKEDGSVILGASEKAYKNHVENIL